MSTNQNAPSVEDTLAKTDLGTTINEYKRPILITFAIVVVLILTYSVTKQFQESATQDRLDQVFKVEQEVFTPYLGAESTMSAEEFKTKLAAISNEYQAHPQLMPTLLQGINKLETENALDQGTIDLALKWIERLDKKSNLYILSSLRISGVLEDNGQTQKGIDLLEGLMANKVELLKTRIQFDLGRLYKKIGNKAKASEYLTMVSETESEFKTIADLYLNEL